MSEKTFIEHSKTEWVPGEKIGEGWPGPERIKMGCLQRIAAATEAMAENNSKLINDLNWYKLRLEEEQQHIYRLEYQIRGLRGAITRLKRINRLHHG